MNIKDKVRFNQDWPPYHKGKLGHIHDINIFIDAISVMVDTTLLTFDTKTFLDLFDTIKSAPPVSCPVVLRKWMKDTEPFLKGDS